MKMTEKDFIDELFGESLDYYPGSKRKRRDAPKPVEIDPSWENDFYEKTLPNGNVVQMYLLGSLAKALNRPVKTVRFWTESGTLPASPYRLPSKIGKNGKEYVGRRLYSKAMIKITVELFEKAGLLDVNPIEWSLHRNLSDKIAEAWETIRAEETK
jgi:hypothetical protein